MHTLPFPSVSIVATTLATSSSLYRLPIAFKATRSSYGKIYRFEYKCSKIKAKGSKKVYLGCYFAAVVLIEMPFKWF